MTAAVKFEDCQSLQMLLEEPAKASIEIRRFVTATSVANNEVIVPRVFPALLQPQLRVESYLIAKWHCTRCHVLGGKAHKYPLMLKIDVRNSDIAHFADAQTTFQSDRECC